MYSDQHLWGYLWLSTVKYNWNTGRLWSIMEETIAVGKG
jgi:hypothetical protein